MLLILQYVTASRSFISQRVKKRKKRERVLTTFIHYITVFFFFVLKRIHVPCITELPLLSLPVPVVVTRKELMTATLRRFHAHARCEDKLHLREIDREMCEGEELHRILLLHESSSASTPIDLYMSTSNASNWFVAGRSLFVSSLEEIPRFASRSFLRKKCSEIVVSFVKLCQPREILSNYPSRGDARPYPVEPCAP